MDDHHHHHQQHQQLFPLHPDRAHPHANSHPHPHPGNNIYDHLQYPHGAQQPAPSDADMYQQQQQYYQYYYYQQQQQQQYMFQLYQYHQQQLMLQHQRQQFVIPPDLARIPPPSLGPRAVTTLPRPPTVYPVTPDLSPPLQRSVSHTTAMPYQNARPVFDSNNLPRPYRQSHHGDPRPHSPPMPATAVPSQPSHSRPPSHPGRQIDLVAPSPQLLSENIPISPTRQSPPPPPPSSLPLPPSASLDSNPTVNTKALVNDADPVDGHVSAPNADAPATVDAATFAPNASPLRASLSRSKVVRRKAENKRSGSVRSASSATSGTRATPENIIHS
ncbi:hypothetical protein HDU84_002036 [Entophlyctis sp. JEL0112]|nr:hypothetical protein HDU84_002036 [Entophlyctis sp. JEL0112]